MGGLIGTLLSGAVTGVKTLIKNAQIGKAATAQGFMQGLITQGQQQTAVAANTAKSPITWLVPLIPIVIGAVVVAVIWKFVLKPIFK